MYHHKFIHQAILQAILLMIFSSNSFMLFSQQADSVNDRVRLLAKETDPVKAEQIMRKNIEELNPDTIQKASEIEMMNGTVALSFLKAGRFSKFEY